jgi:hypothetical protein
MIDMVKLTCPKWLKKCFPFFLLVTQLMFPSKTIVCNLIEFSWQKLLEIQYFLNHLASKTFQITFIKSYS